MCVFLCTDAYLCETLRDLYEVHTLRVSVCVYVGVHVISVCIYVYMFMLVCIYVCIYVMYVCVCMHLLG